MAQMPRGDPSLAFPWREKTSLLSHFLSFEVRLECFMFCFETASKVCGVLLRLSENLSDRLVSNPQWQQWYRILVYVYSIKGITADKKPAVILSLLQD